MEHNIKNWLPFYVGYLGQTTSAELSILIKQPYEETFNELERLVNNGKLESKLVAGELTYYIRPDNDHLKRL